MSILVVAAHPDDEILGCGGTIARFAAEGKQVTVAILGQGAASRYGPGATGVGIEVDRLMEMSREAGRVVGATEVRHFGLPDNRFDSADLLEIVRILEQVGRDVDPELVYTQHGGDLNIDHALTFRAAMTAFRPMPGTAVQALYAYEVASSTEWAFNRYAPVFAPDTFVDIGAYLERKLMAMAVYADELRGFPHPRSVEGITSQARERGSRIGVEAAEAFMTIWRRI